MSYSPAGRWVSERLSSATPSENEQQASPKPGYTKSSTRFMVPLGMPRNYDEDYEDYEAHHERIPAGYQDSGK